MKLIVFAAAVIAVAMAANVKMAPLLGDKAEKPIEGSYIVVLNPDTTKEKMRLHLATVNEMIRNSGEKDNQVKFIYETVLKGYSAVLSDKARDRIRLMPEVKYVERNQEVHLVQGEACTTDDVRSWGIPRTAVTGRVPPEETFEYIYDLNCDGEGSDVYIIDTGIDLENTGQYFEGRARFGIDYVGDGLTGDPNGHGTHVAGTVASITYGLAVKANVVAVRVLNSFGSGTFEAVIAGINWVPQQSGTRKIINMSLGGGYSQAVIDAVEDAYQAGVHVVVAAGNENTDACSRSPAAAPYATTVGATDISDARATFSNYGECVEVFAPGVSIIAPYQRGEPASLSGTSMASPHVAGVVAKLLTASECRGGVADDPQSVENYLRENALEDILTGIPANTPNLLLHMHCEG